MPASNKRSRRTTSQNHPPRGPSHTPLHAAKHGIVAKPRSCSTNPRRSRRARRRIPHTTAPPTPTSVSLVDTLINSEWRIRRTRRSKPSLEHATTTFWRNIPKPACSSATPSPRLPTSSASNGSPIPATAPISASRTAPPQKVGQALPPANPGPHPEPNPPPMPATRTIQTHSANLAEAIAGFLHATSSK